MFGWLDNIGVWRDLPYPVKGALLRGVKIALSGILGWLIAQITAGTLFPEGTDAAFVLVAAFLLPSLDKFKRELDAWNEITRSEEPLSEAPPVETDSTDVTDTTDVVEDEEEPKDSV